MIRLSRLLASYRHRML